MNSFKQGTTPHFTITNFGNTKLRDYLKYRITFSQKDIVITKEFSASQLRVNSYGQDYLTFSLTQEETFRFNPGPCRVEIRAMAQDGRVEGGEIGNVEVKDTADTVIMTR